MATPGFTSVWNVPRHSPPRSFTAPTSVMAQELAEPPVVSRSTTTNVTSWSGAPSSSNDRCTKADGKGTWVRRQEHMFDSKRANDQPRRSVVVAAGPDAAAVFTLDRHAPRRDLSR